MSVSVSLHFCFQEEHQNYSNGSLKEDTAHIEWCEELIYSQTV